MAQSRQPTQRRDADHQPSLLTQQLQLQPQYLPTTSNSARLQQLGLNRPDGSAARPVPDLALDPPQLSTPDVPPPGVGVPQLQDPATQAATGTATAGTNHLQLRPPTVPPPPPTADSDFSLQPPELELPPVEPPHLLEGELQQSAPPVSIEQLMETHPLLRIPVEDPDDANRRRLNESLRDQANRPHGEQSTNNRQPSSSQPDLTFGDHDLQLSVEMGTAEGYPLRLEQHRRALAEWRRGGCRGPMPLDPIMGDYVFGTVRGTY